MAAKPDGPVEMTDEEIDALVAAVSEEFGPVLDDDGDIDFDIDTEPSSPATEASTASTKTTTESVIKPSASVNEAKVTQPVVNEPKKPDEKQQQGDLQPVKQTAEMKVDKAEKSSLQSNEDASPATITETPVTEKSCNVDIKNTTSTAGGTVTSNVMVTKIADVGTVCAIKTPDVAAGIAVKTPDVAASAAITGKTITENTEVSKDTGNEHVDQKEAAAAAPVVDDELKKPAADASVTDVKKTQSPSKKKSGTEEQKKQVAGGGGWGWGSIGSWSSSVLATATNISSQVGESFYHVLETVEATLVEPEEGAAVADVDNRQLASEVDKSHDESLKESTNPEQKLEDSKSVDGGARVDGGKMERGASGADIDDDKVDVTVVSESQSAAAAAKDTDQVPVSPNRKQKVLESPSDNTGWLLGWDLTHLTSKGKKVVTTGLGVIGNIGKKTYNALMEDDDDSAAVAGDAYSTKLKHLDSIESRIHFKSSQDDAGVAHLEALEELCHWSTDSLNKQLLSLRGNCADSLRDDLTLIQESFGLGELDDLMEVEGKDHDFKQLLTDFVSQLGFNLNVDKLISVQQNTRQWLSEHTGDVSQAPQLSPIELHKVATQYLGEFTGTAVALYHKVGQLLLIEHSIPLLSYKFRALSLAGLTKVLCIELCIESNHFCRILNGPSLNVGSGGGRAAATSIELETSNNCSSLRDACSFLLPIMQLAVVRIHPLLTEHSGIAHLESLQVLSGMSHSNVREAVGRLQQREHQQIVETELTAIESAFDLGYMQQDDDDEQNNEAFSSKVSDLVRQLPGCSDSAKRLVQNQQRVRKYLSDCQRDLKEAHINISANDIHQVAVQSLTDLASCSIDLFYHIAQSMLLDQARPVQSYVAGANTLASLTKILCIEVGNQSSHFTDCLNSAAGDVPDSVTPLVTNIYLEASSSSTYIQDALQLLLPVVQLALVKAHPLCTAAAAAAHTDNDVGGASNSVATDLM